MSFDFQKNVKRWKSPPFTGLGYFSTEKMLEKSDEEIISIVNNVEKARYAGNEGAGWRNGMGLDTITGKTVLDFGCGMGIEALQLAKNGNNIILADIVQSNIDFSAKVLELFGFGDKIAGKILVDGEPPYFDSQPFDVFYSVVALCFSPDIGGIISRAVNLSPDCEVRLLLYSEKSWENITGKKANDNAPITDEYINGMDPGSQYCEWYSKNKLSKLVKGVLNIEDHRFVGEIFSAFTLVKEKPKKKSTPKKKSATKKEVTKKITKKKSRVW